MAQELGLPLGLFAGGFLAGELAGHHSVLADARRLGESLWHYQSFGFALPGDGPRTTLSSLVSPGLFLASTLSAVWAARRHARAHHVTLLRRRRQRARPSSRRLARGPAGR